MKSHRPPDRLITEFRRLFGSDPRLFRAPGRINLIGEHTDYNDGFVMPSAIDFATWVAAEPRADRKIVARSLAFDSTVEVELEGDRAVTESWARIIKSVASALTKNGVAVAGANIVVRGDVPMGAGLSSSASFEVALALCFTTLSNSKLSPKLIALAAQAAEIEAIGARVGIMDQFV